MLSRLRCLDWKTIGKEYLSKHKTVNYKVIQAALIIAA